MTHREGAVMTLRHHRDGDLLAVKIALPHGVTDRLACVSYLSQYGDALCLVDCTGALIDGEVVSFRSMTDAEEEAWFNYPRICAYEQAEREADPEVLDRVVMVLLVAMRGPRVVTVHGEEVRGAA